MKKILVFSTSYLPFIGGAELAIKEIAERLPDMAFHIITPRFKGSLPKMEKIGDVVVHRVGLGISFDKFLIPITGFFAALSLHRQERFNLVWAMMASQASVAAALFKVFKRRVPLVLTLQEGDEEEHLKRYVFGSELLFRIFIKPWHTFVFKVADHITVISKHLGERARAHNKSVPIVLVPNGVDVRAFERAGDKILRNRARKEFGFSESDSVVVTVSRLVEKNRVDTLIRAIAALPPPFKLLVAGTGHLESELKRLATELGVSPRVVFAGSVEPADVVRVLSAGDVFARPSATEGFGSVFLEAMAAGLPVIATNVGGIKDFVVDKQTGLFCSVGDADDLARKITILTRDFIVRGEIIEQAKDMVRAHYDWKQVALSMKEKAFDVLIKNTSLRIVIATGIYSPDVGGPAEYAKNLFEVWRREGHRVSVHHFRRLRVFPAGFRHFLYFLGLLPSVARADCVVITDTFSAAVPAVLAGRLCKTRTLIRTGGDFLWERYVDRTGKLVLFKDFYRTCTSDFSFTERFIFSLIRFSLQRADTLVFSTPWQRDLFVPAYDLRGRTTHIVENYYGPKLGALPYAEKNFVATTRLRLWKNTDRIKKAFSVVRNKGIEVRYDDTGMPYGAFLEHIRRSYAVIVASLGDISPNMILDAIRADKPFIITQETGLTERIREIALFVDPADVDDIASKIEWLADEHNYRAQQEKVRSFSFTHSWEEIASELLSLARPS